MAETMATEGWLVLRPGKNGRHECLGFFKTKQIAEENAALLRGDWYVVGSVPLLGWGFIEETGRVLKATPLTCPSYDVH